MLRALVAEILILASASSLSFEGVGGPQVDLSSQVSPVNHRARTRA